MASARKRSGIGSRPSLQTRARFSWRWAQIDIASVKSKAKNAIRDTQYLAQIRTLSRSQSGNAVGSGEAEVANDTLSVCIRVVHFTVQHETAWPWHRTHPMPRHEIANALVRSHLLPRNPIGIADPSDERRG